ncbi:MAG: MFS transporter [Phycisphaerae bacterium]|jgi:MFS family permease
MNQERSDQHAGEARVGKAAWMALIAAGAGWMLDATDVMLYSFALGEIRAEFGIDNAQAGLIASATLVASAVGGAAAGVLCDRIGRVRVLMLSILFYSIFTALSATSRSPGELAFWRVLVGLGLGAEWSAGSVLVAETWPARHRGKAIGLMQSGWALGCIVAALASAAILPTLGWRWLFALGILPALLVVVIRMGVKEPVVWETSRREASRPPLLRTLATPPYARRVVVATLTTSALLFAYWGLFTWVPQHLARSTGEGGAGLGLVKSTKWIVAMQVGAFLGYTSFGFFADRFGRRPAFIAWVLGAAAVVPVYALYARNESVLLIAGPLVGFFGHGYFSVFGAILAELFPTSVRGAAQGLCYNAGRAVSALAPWAVGSVADRHGLGVAIALTSVLYLVGAALVIFLPETRGKEIT